MVVSRHLLNMEAWVQSQSNPCGISGGQTGTAACFSPSSNVFPFPFVISAIVSILICDGC
jgi:hypothetical protein